MEVSRSLKGVSRCFPSLDDIIISYLELIVNPFLKLFQVFGATFKAVDLIPYLSPCSYDTTGATGMQYVRMHKFSDPDLKKFV
jgi:hypothetical protein